jgi:hypothetical protein
MMKRLLVLLGIVLLLGAAFAQRELLPQNRVGVQISVQPKSYAGPCPVSLKLGARISLDFKTVVMARFIDSNGRGTRAQELKFTGAQTLVIRDTMSFSGNFNGWIAVELGPRDPAPWAKGGVVLNAKKVFLSEKVNVSLQCLGAQITNASIECEGEPPREIDLSGSGFGATRGNRQVLQDGIPASSYVSWSDTFITFMGSAILSPDHAYAFVVKDGANPVTNTFSKKFLLCWCDDPVPAAAPVNAEVELRLFMDASSPGGYVVKMGTITMPVLSWSGSPSITIRVRVPSAAPGNYKITIQKNGAAVTKELSFAVTS